MKNSAKENAFKEKIDKFCTFFQTSSLRQVISQLYGTINNDNADKSTQKAIPSFSSGVFNSLKAVPFSLNGVKDKAASVPSAMSGEPSSLKALPYLSQGVKFEEESVPSALSGVTSSSKPEPCCSSVVRFLLKFVRFALSGVCSLLKVVPSLLKPVPLFASVVDSYKKSSVSLKHLALNHSKKWLYLLKLSLNTWGFHQHYLQRKGHSRYPDSFS